jgi:hypothetical protein
MSGLGDIQAMKALKIANKHENTNNFLKSIMSLTEIIDVKKTNYPIVTNDYGGIGTSGFMTDAPSVYTTSFDNTSKDITVTHTPSLSSGYNTANEFFIGNDELQQVLNNGGIKFSCGIETQMTLTDFVVELYYLVGTTATLISSQSVVSNPVINQIYNINVSYASSSIPATANGLKLYVKVKGYSAGTKITKIHNFLIGYLNNNIYASGQNKTNAVNEFLSALKLSRNWNGKKWNSVGDSVTAFNKYQPAVISSIPGLIYTNYGVSSTTVAINNTYITGMSFAERVPQMADADLWTILGGYNDWYYNTPLGTISDSPSTSKNTFYGGLKACVENILGRSNNPKLLLCTPLQSTRNGNSASTISNPSTAPTLATSGTGGFLPATTYYVKYTWVNVNGETQVSPEASITTAGATSTITVTIPALPAQVISANIYISTSTNSETKQGSTTGTTYTQSATLVVGSTTPSSNGATVTPYSMLSICQAIKDVGQYYSVPVLDLYSIGGFNPLNLGTMTLDGVHPSDLGTLIHAPKWIQAIRNLT